MRKIDELCKKHKIAIILGLFLLITMAHLYKLKHEEHKAQTDGFLYMVDGDEPPGIGATKESPDTALVYCMGRDVYIRYLHDDTVSQFRLTKADRSNRHQYLKIW